MLLRELFDLNIDQDKKEDKRLDPEINYFDDLKFFVDNDEQVLSKVFFPAIKKHIDNPEDKEAYKHYLEPLHATIKIYCKKYNLDDIKDKIFQQQGIVDLAKKFAEEQSKHIKNKDYED